MGSIPVGDSGLFLCFTLVSYWSVYFSDEHNIFKNPNLPEANQLAIHNRGRRFEFGATEKQIQVVVRAGLEPGFAGLRVRHADHSATLPSLTDHASVERWYEIVEVHFAEMTGYSC